jgi:2-polyprenyl-3-methyl-5-hydroxy-6-metoxy-1,4-benzoquinol methylase
VKNILLVMLEFDNWNQARAWSYTGSWAFVDGFEENGHRCTVLPAISGRSSGAPESFLSHAETLLEGQVFDEAWVWCVHADYDERFWTWLEGVAPKRVGVVMESLTVTAAQAMEFPQFEGRSERGLAQLAHCTHAVLADEADIELIESRLAIPAIWNVVMVPERFVRFDAAPSERAAVFIGNKYGERRAYLEDAELSERLVRPHVPERDTELPSRFDQVHRAMRDALAAGAVGPQWLADGVAELRGVRQELFRLHLDGIRMGFANVNLPSMLMAYAGRVTEAMAAATPAVTWVPPERPRCASLFRPGVEIEVFSSPEDLKQVLARMAESSERRNRLVIEARNTLLNRHTARIRARQFQNWIDDGVSPAFGEDIGYRPSVQESEYYKHFFAEDPSWSRPTPNGDERARWSKIEPMLASVREGAGRPLEIAEVGCGRGWLANLCSAYGHVVGCEPVGEVIDHARRLFPALTFMTGSAELLGFVGYAGAFDVVVCSEVIEHVPHAAKATFVAGLTRLLKPGGHVIITTPRMDIYPEWRAKYGAPPQPTEDWLTEAALEQLLRDAGCTPVDLQRAFLLDIYQIWLFQCGAT